MLISKNTIVRLSKYRNALCRFKALGFIKVYSDNLSDAVGGTSVQVRKDFSIFKLSGHKRGGYFVDTLITELNEILGKNEQHNVVIVGAGKIGSALIKYKGFEKEGINITACFDIDPAKANKSSSIPVYPMDALKDFVKKSNIKVGIIAVPDIAAQQVLDILIEAGITGILNFAPIDLKYPENVVCNNVNLALELENVIYFVHIAEKTKNTKAKPVK